MRTHNYLCRINDDQWIDLMKIKSLDKRSFNSLIQEGCRLVVKEKLGIISKQRKQRNSLNNMFLNEAWGNIIDLENKSRINLNFEFKGFNSKKLTVGKRLRNSIFN